MQRVEIISRKSLGLEQFYKVFSYDIVKQYCGIVRNLEMNVNWTQRYIAEASDDSNIASINQYVEQVMVIDESASNIADLAKQVLPGLQKILSYLKNGYGAESLVFLLPIAVNLANPLDARFYFHNMKPKANRSASTVNAEKAETVQLVVQRLLPMIMDIVVSKKTAIRFWNICQLHVIRKGVSKGLISFLLSGYKATIFQHPYVTAKLYQFSCFVFERIVFLGPPSQFWIGFEPDTPIMVPTKPEPDKKKWLHRLKTFRNRNAVAAKYIPVTDIDSPPIKVIVQSIVVLDIFKCPSDELPSLVMQVYPLDCELPSQHQNYSRNEA